MTRCSTDDLADADALARAPPPRAHRVLLPDARLGLRGRRRRAGGRWSGLAGRTTASRDGRRCARGCSASPPTCATTRCGAGAVGPSPMDLGPPGAGRPTPTGPALDLPWLTPLPPPTPRGRRGGDPADVAAAARHPAPGVRGRPAAPAARPRAVLILRDVLGWSAPEVADLLDASPTSVHSVAPAGARHARPPDPAPARRARSRPRRSWPATSTRSHVTTSPGSWLCSTRTPSCRCPRTPCGCRVPRRSSGGSGPGPPAAATAWSPRRPTAYRPSGSTTGRRPFEAFAVQVVEWSTTGSPASTPSSTPTSSLDSACRRPPLIWLF